MNFEKGKTPHVEFQDNEIYKVVEKFTYVKISAYSFIYIPDFNQIKNHYIKYNISLDYLIGKACHTNNSYTIYQNQLEFIRPSYDEYYNHLVKLARKLFYLENSFDDIFNFFKNCLEGMPNIPYEFDDDDINNICNEAECLHSTNPYVPVQKCVVFNPLKNLNPTFKQIIYNKELGNLNSKIICQLSKNKTRKQIQEVTSLSSKTINKHLSKQKKSTKGVKKKQTFNLVQNWRKKNKNKTQKQCAIDLQIGLRTVKCYWNKKENNTNINIEIKEINNDVISNNIEIKEAEIKEINNNVIRNKKRITNEEKFLTVLFVLLILDKKIREEKLAKELKEKEKWKTIASVFFLIGSYDFKKKE